MTFRDGRPGRKFVKYFLERHSSIIKLGKPRKEQELRYKSCNADTISTNFAALKKIISDNNIDSSRICNIDETGSTTEREAGGRLSKKRVLRSGKANRSVVRVPTFKNVDRITMLPTIFANGELGEPLFVIKGKNIPYRETVVSGPDNHRYDLEFVHDCLPSNSFVTKREGVAGVDATIFTSWAEHFVKFVENKTMNGKKVLLIYDGYKSHIGIKALDILHNGGVIAYCLPSHTSGLLQPLDVAVFGLCKSYLRECICELARSYECLEFDQFDYQKLMNKAYIKAFTSTNIISGFNKSGCYPVDPTKIIQDKFPACFESPNETVSSSQLQEMLSKKIKSASNGDCLQPFVVKRGHVSTKEGLVVTDSDVRNVIRAQHEIYVRNAQKKELQSNKRDLRWEKEKEAKSSQRFDFEKRALAARISKYGVPNQMPRALKVRRAVARMNALSKKAGKVAQQ